MWPLTSLWNKKQKPANYSTKQRINSRLPKYFSINMFMVFQGGFFSWGGFSSLRLPCACAWTSEDLTGWTVSHTVILFLDLGTDWDIRSLLVVNFPKSSLGYSQKITSISVYQVWEHDAPTTQLQALNWPDEHSAWIPQLSGHRCFSNSRQATTLVSEGWLPSSHCTIKIWMVMVLLLAGSPVSTHELWSSVRSRFRFSGSSLIKALLLLCSVLQFQL